MTAYAPEDQFPIEGSLELALGPLIFLVSCVLVSLGSTYILGRIANFLPKVLTVIISALSGLGLFIAIFFAEGLVRGDKIADAFYGAFLVSHQGRYLYITAIMLSFVASLLLLVELQKKQTLNNRDSR